MNRPPLEVVDLGRRPYLEVLELQRSLRLARIEGSLPHDTLLLVEHEPVYTLGRGTRASSLPLPVAALEALGATVVEVERGGDVTWHGPGQLVGYPILNLSAHREDLHWYLRTLEQALIDALANLGVAAERLAGKTGVWTAGGKIASLGIHVKQWVTLHGFAINVAPDLHWFGRIVPCGLDGVTMTSIARETGRRPDDPTLWADALSATVSAFGEAFSLAPRDASRSLAIRTGSGHPSPYG
ncbi:MAG: lipoyl(octanoyl) transferase LipB [Gemmatimonadota bacterium]